MLNLIITKGSMFDFKWLPFLSCTFSPFCNVPCLSSTNCMNIIHPNDQTVYSFNMLVQVLLSFLSWHLIYRVYMKSGLRSPMGARVFPESHNSWYFSILPCRRPSRRALFSYMQYALLCRTCQLFDLQTIYKKCTYTLAAVKTHDTHTNASAIVWPRIYFGAWSGHESQCIRRTSSGD